MVPFAIAAAWLVACTGEPAGVEPVELPDLPAPLSERPTKRGPVEVPRQLRIALTGEVRGELEPCGCPTLPYGGFVRRERLLDELSVAARPLFQLDAGETLLKGLSARREEPPQARAELIAQLMDIVGVQAMAPGPSDLLALGVEGLLRFDWDTGFPLVSATWRRPGGERLFRAWTTVEAGGLSLGVVGLSGTPTARETRDLVAVEDPVIAARAAVAELPDVDLVVALSNLEESDAERVASEVEGLALVLTTRDGRHDPPRTTPRAPVVEVPSRGRYVTLVSVHAGAPAGWAAEEAETALLERSWQLAEQLSALGSRPDAREDVVAALTAEQLDVEAALEAAGAGRNLMLVEDLPLGARLDGDAASVPLLEDYKQERLVWAEEVVEESEREEGPRYASSAACTSCHSQQVARWAFTAHARALRSLQRRDAEENPECLGCHTTGFAEPGGFAELDKFHLARFGGVQCEACHGQLAGHPEDDGVKPQAVTPATCERCHDEANSPNFDFLSYLPRAHCTPVEKAPPE